MHSKLISSYGIPFNVVSPMPLYLGIKTIPKTLLQMNIKREHEIGMLMRNMYNFM